MATMADTRGRRTRRSFTDDYKTGAVRLVLDEGKTVAAAARDLGLTESSLRNWVEQARADRTKGRTGLTTEERAELASLRKDNRELRMERDILKKAAVNSGGRRNAMTDRRDHAARATIADERGRQDRNMGAVEARTIA
jgi:transposase